MRAVVAAAVACLSVVSLSHADDARASIKKELSIPAQELVPALQALSREAKIHLVYLAEDVRGRRTVGAAGMLSINEALERILSGTGLTFRYIDEQTISILPVAPSGQNSTGAQNDASSQTTSAGPRVEGATTASRSDSESSLWARFRLAQAQDAKSADNESVERSGDATSAKPAIEEIIVTARKREERIQDVPMSLTAIGSAEISERGLISASDYLRGVPGVNQTERADGQTIVIRGLETSPQGQNFGSGVTVGTYFGETPTTNSGGLVSDTNIDIKLVDIERIEVLRGPQGTAYGSSSLGGTIRTIPYAPDTGELEGSVRADYSATASNGGENTHIQGVLNLPLVADRFAIRAVGYRFEDGGWYDNNAATDPVLQTILANTGALDAGVSYDEAGESTVRGGRLSALWEATSALEFTVSYLSQTALLEGYGLSNRPEYVQALPLVAPEHVVEGSRRPTSETSIDILNATARYDFGWANLLATYSYVDSGTQRSFPFYGFNFPDAASNIGIADHKEDIGEVRLATTFEGALNFLAGLYFEHVEDDYFRDDIWHGDPAANRFARGQRSLGSFRDQREREQVAGFGELTWEFLTRWTFTGGVRVYEQDRDYQRTNAGPFYGVIPVSSQATASGSTYRANLSYQPNDNALFYADFSQGFRLGNPSTGLAAARCDVNGDGLVDGTSNTTIASTREIGPDAVDSFEVGIRFAELDQRLTGSISAFHIEWDDPPFRVIAPLPPAGCGLSYAANAAHATSEGVELQAGLRVSPALRVYVGASWLDAQLTEDAPGVGGLDGDRLPNSPDFNANFGIEYEFALWDRAAHIRADAVRVSSYYAGLKPVANLKGGGYAKLDLAGRLRPTDRLVVDLYARNITDEDEFTYRDVLDFGPDFGYRLRPRTIGVQLAYEF